MMISYFVFDPLAILGEKSAFGKVQMYDTENWVDSVIKNYENTTHKPSECIWFVPGTLDNDGNDIMSSDLNLKGA